MSQSLNLISKTDFIGFKNIDFVESDDLFDTYAEQATIKVMMDLCGEELYDDIIANPGNYTDFLELCKPMMVGFFYYYFNIDRESFSTSIGEFEAVAENSTSTYSNMTKKVSEAWNDGVKWYIKASKLIDAPTVIRTPINVFGISYNVNTTGYPFDHSDWFIKGK